MSNWNQSEIEHFQYQQNPVNIIVEFVFLQI